MKIIDDKGRLFGKLNIFDLFVILAVLLTLVSIGSYAYHKPDQKQVEVELMKTLPERLYNTIDTDDIIYNKGYTYWNQTLRRVEANLTANITVELDKEGNWIYDHQQVKIGKNLLISTPHIHLEGVIINVRETN